MESFLVLVAANHPQSPWRHATRAAAAFSAAIMSDLRKRLAPGHVAGEYLHPDSACLQRMLLPWPPVLPGRRPNNAGIWPFAGQPLSCLQTEATQSPVTR